MTKRSPKRVALKPQRFCIFCGKSNLSREHLWSEWISKIVPKDADCHTNTKIRFEYLRPVTMDPPVGKVPQGDIASKKLKVVCKRCNETWMGDIEQQARLVMIPLIRGEVTRLSPDDQATLATWITLKSIIAEFDDQRHAAVAEEERRQFYHQKAALPNWKIWIGYYEGAEWIKRYRHAGWSTINIKELPRSGIIHPPKCNSQSSTFVVGNLYMHAISSSVAAFKEFTLDGYTENRLLPLHPTSASSHQWPNKPIINDNDAMAISEAFHKACLTASLPPMF